MRIDYTSAALRPTQTNLAGRQEEQKSLVKHDRTATVAAQANWHNAAAREPTPQVVCTSRHALAAPAQKQGPLTRLPLELSARILSHLKNETLSTQLLPRTLSRALYEASLLGQPELNDRLASGYLRRILAQDSYVETQLLENFLVQQAPKMRMIDLTASYRQKDSAKDALLHRLLSERAVDVHTLNLRRCTAFTQLPKNLTTIGGNLDVNCTGITQLPAGLTTVGGYLDIRFTAITKLPEGLTKLGGTLDASGTNITCLPEGLTTVGGSLSLAYSGVTRLPVGLTTVGGSLSVEHTGITHLPAGLRAIGGTLYLSGTRITHLPQVLTVGQNLSLRGSSVTQLPQWLTVGGNLDLRRTGITQLPQKLTVGGYLSLDGTGITQLPRGLTVGGPLILNGSAVTQLPGSLTVGENLYLRNTRITQLPMDLKVSGQIVR